MVMDEAGRNGRKWHLAQQLAQPVIRYVLSPVTITHRECIDWGDFYFYYKYQKIPPYAIIIIYNLLTNSKSKYGIIRWWEYDDVKNCHILYRWNGLG